ncbi:hypothetical protein [Pelagicoccus sp. SDUM812005]|uniref:hypothetical protein n=1 Tax=Pelagicoccus sp. SDUM812005 TaxID=3041257 RepID=UPI00280DC93F|nr:hypothetical protein [Pelagicoccus sp. SDUM812005]MDQ8182580.1 hypothetical protein [Pelagicoccus sp. SDUM812005]
MKRELFITWALMFAVILSLALRKFYFTDSNTALQTNGEDVEKTDFQEEPVFGGTLTRSSNKFNRYTVFEESIEKWTTKVSVLGEYVDGNPDLTIPEMSNLSESDWLEVTKAQEFQGEGDFRKSMSKLRWIAKRGTQLELARVVNRLMKENLEFPKDKKGLLNYLPVGFDPRILDRYDYFPLGNDEVNSSGRRVVLVERAVDPIWDSTSIITDSGTLTNDHGSRSYRKPMQESIEAYISSHGVGPKSHRDIELMFDGEDLDQESIEVLFAYTLLRR